MFHAMDEVTAIEAGVSLVAVDVEGEISGFGARSGARVFAFGGTEGEAQSVYDGAMEGMDARGREGGHRLRGMDAGEEERFGGIDVAESSDAFLIEEE